MVEDIALATPTMFSGVWARAFALVYDPLLWLGERTGVRALRRELLERARGHTLEIGAGTGLNLRHYPEAVTELVLTEPDLAMRSRLDAKVRRSRRQARVLDAPAHDLPFADASVDTVVSTLVLCTVDAPHLALQEIVRVLRPGGQLLFIEHVRSDSPRLARWQDRFEKPWKSFARGCRCNRATGALIPTCGLALDDVRETSWHAVPPIVRPLIVGRAQKENRDG